MNTKKLSIVMVNYNSGVLVEHCIESIYQHITLDFEIIFVDNRSTDGSFEAIKSAYPDILYLQNEHNLGFAKAINIGLEKSRGEFILSLDTDTVILPGAIERLIEVIESDTGIGGIGSRLIFPDGTIQHTARRFPNPLNGLFGRRSLLTKIWPNNRFSKNYLMLDEEESSTPYQVDSLSAACFIIRRSTYDSVGGPDPEYFLYWADTDWCYKIKDAGWKIVAVPDSIVVHDENIEKGRRERRKTNMIIHFHKGVYRYYTNNVIKSVFNPMWVVLVFGLILRASVLIIKDEYEYRTSS